MNEMQKITGRQVDRELKKIGWELGRTLLENIWNDDDELIEVLSANCGRNLVFFNMDGDWVSLPGKKTKGATFAVAIEETQSDATVVGNCPDDTKGFIKSAHSVPKVLKNLYIVVDGTHWVTVTEDYEEHTGWCLCEMKRVKK